MNATVLSLTRPFTTTPIQSPPSAYHRHLRSLKTGPIRSSASGSGSGGGSNNSAINKSENTAPIVPPPVTPPDAVEIRFRRGSRKRSRQKEDSELAQMAEASAPKDWEAMSLKEKAIELYVGEKGLLFWLNKFAYASIFIIIGGWILFRFVGPALNLYQLDTPPLSPSNVLKGS